MNKKAPLDQLNKLISGMPEDRQMQLLHLLRSGGWDIRGSREHIRKKLVHKDLEAVDTVDYSVKDLSMGGAFVQTDQPLSVGQEVSLDITVPPRFDTVTVPGRVVRITDSGFGIAFDVLDKNLETVLASLLSAGKGA